MNSIVKGFAFNLQARKRLEDGVVGSTVWRRTVPSRYERSRKLRQPASKKVTSDRVKRAPRGLAAVTRERFARLIVIGYQKRFVISEYGTRQRNRSKVRRRW